MSNIKQLKFVSVFVDMYSFADYISKIVLVPTKQLFMIQRRVAYNGRKHVNKIMSLLSRVKKVRPETMENIAEKLEEETDKLEYVKGGEIKKETQKVVRKLETIKEKPTKKNIEKVKEETEKVEVKLEEAIG